MTTQEILQLAQGARMPLALADTHAKNQALEAMAVALIAAGVTHLPDAVFYQGYMSL